MEDKYIENLISNEKEWRRHIYSEVKDIKERVINFGNRVTKVEVTHKWLWSVVGVSLLGILISLIQGIL